MNLRNFIARLLGVAVAFALGCYLLKLGVTFLADIWIGLAIIGGDRSMWHNRIPDLQILEKHFIGVSLWKKERSSV